MKKGFTLIELLAVILILGIIALIAIPTVNKIISEARYGAFKSGNDNIMKTIEQDCQTSLMKGENPILSYLFNEGKSSNQINIKGTLPDDGYILLNKECTIIDYYLTDNKNIYSTGKDAREDYMLKAPTGYATSYFQVLYPDYFDNIRTIKFIKNLNIPNEAIEIKDISKLKNENIKSWLIPNEEFYDLYIGSENIIYANYNSSYMFAGLKNLSNIDLDNFETSFVKNMNHIFSENVLMEIIENINFDTTNVLSMKGLFYNCYKLKYLDVSDWNVSNVTNMQSIFYYAKSLKELNTQKWDVSNVTNMNHLFHGCSSLENVYISNWNTGNVTTLGNMFYGCKNLTRIDLSNWDTSNVVEMHGMFMYCTGIKKIDLSNWNTKSLKNIYYYDGWTNFGIFDNCQNLEELYLSNWDVSNVKSLRQAFNDCKSLKILDISNWNLDNVEDYTYIFNNCNKLENIKILNNIVLNNIGQYLPDRTSLESGIVTIIGDKTGVDTTTINSKNWYVV